MDDYASPITFGPGDDAEQFEDDLLPTNLQPLFEESLRAASASLDSPTQAGGGLWLLISLVVFVLASLGGFNWGNIGLLVGVLLLHESGHFLGMKLFGYRDVKMFFIPFFGAAVSGKKHAAEAWQEIIVLLLGPLPGLLLGAALYFTLQPEDTKSVLFQAISMLLILNAFNLLPFMPLDGGRIMNLLIFRRHPILEVLFKLFAVAGLALFAFLLRSWVLGLVAFFTLASVRFGYQLASRARRLRLQFPGISAEWNELGLRELTPLFVQGLDLLPTDRVPMNVGKRMLLLHEQAAASSPGALGTLFWLGVYGGSFLIGPVVGLIIGFNLNANQPAVPAFIEPPEVRQLLTEAHELLNEGRALQQPGAEPSPEERAKIQELGEAADEKLRAAIRLLMLQPGFGNEDQRDLLNEITELRREAIVMSRALDPMRELKPLVPAPAQLDPLPANAP